MANRTFLDHGYDVAHFGLVLHGPLCLLSHSCLYPDHGRPYGVDLSLCLCLSPDFFLYLCQIRENDAAQKKTRRSNKHNKELKPSSALYNCYGEDLVNMLFIGQSERD